MTAEQFGIYLKSLREKSGKTQFDVSKDLGYSTPQFVSNIERGISPLPIFKIKTWAKSIGAKPREILDQYGEVRRAQDLEVFNSSKAGE